MPPAARAGDATSHPGVISPLGAVANVLICGQPAAVVGTMHTCAFPPPAVHPPTPILPPGSNTVFIGSRPAARIGDATGCGATILLGALNVMVGG